MQIGGHGSIVGRAIFLQPKYSCICSTPPPCHLTFTIFPFPAASSLSKPTFTMKIQNLPKCALSCGSSRTSPAGKNIFNSYLATHYFQHHGGLRRFYASGNVKEANPHLATIPQEFLSQMNLTKHVSPTTLHWDTDVGYKVAPEVRRDIADKKFFVNRATELHNDFDPHPFNFPYQDPERFVLPPFFTKDDKLVKRLNKDGDSFDAKEHIQTFAQRRIYTLWLMWRMRVREALTLMDPIIEEKPEIPNARELNDLMHIFAGRKLNDNHHKLFEHYVVNGNLKPNAVTFKILFMNARRVNFHERLPLWEEQMKKHNIEWDADLLALRLAKEVLTDIDQDTTELVKKFTESFWWPLSSQYQSGSEPTAGVFRPTADTYLIFLSVLRRPEQKDLAESCFAAFLDVKDQYSKHSFENICQKMVLYYAWSRHLNDMMQFIEEHFVHQSETTSEDKLHLPRKIMYSMLYIALRGKSLPWEGAVRVLDWNRAEIASSLPDEMLVKPYHIFLNKLLTAHESSLPENTNLAFDVFMKWFAPVIERHTTTVNAPRKDSKPGSSKREEVDDTMWTTYDLRAFDDDYSQYQSDEVAASKKAENFLNHYTPKTQLYETFRFQKRLVQPSAQDYRDMMSYIVKRGNVDQALLLVRIAEADMSGEKRDAELLIDLISSTIAMFVREKNLTKALILFLQHFRSTLRGSKGKFVPPEHVLLLFKEAFAEAQAESLEEQFAVLLRRHREREGDYY